MSSPCTLAVLSLLLAACTSRPTDVGANPLEGVELSARSDTAFEGHVAEVIVAGPYRYVLVDVDGGGRQWVATLALREAPEGLVRVRPIASRDQFRSPRLGRTFDHLVFGIVEAR
jgi:hypothetical protein